MITLKNKAKAVKVLKANGMPTLRVLPGCNYVNCSKEDIQKYCETPVNKAMIKESIKFVDIDLDEESKIEAQKALELNEKLNKAQKVIFQQNKQILSKDENNNSQAAMIKEQGELIKELMKKIEKIEKKSKKVDK